MPETPAPHVPAQPAWWQARWFVALCLLLIAAPLAWPAVPPLTDLPGHLGRYRIILDLDTSAHLQRFYRFDWTLVPNLGVDLLMVPLSRLLGLEPAVKLIVLLTPVLTLLGFIWVAREAHGHIPPTWLFAAPLILGYPFHFGFVNFTLSLTLAFLALGLWLHLGRTGRRVLRAALFVPIALGVWLCHATGWGVLGLLVWAAEFARQQARGRALLPALVAASLACLPLAGPAVATLAWQSGGPPAVTREWFNLPWKLASIAAALRDRWIAFDIASVCVLLAAIAAGLASRRVRRAPGLALGALLLLAAFVLLPQILLGSSRADIRLVPVMLAVALLSLRPAGGQRFATAVALAGLAFFATRIAGNTASLWLYDQSYRTELAALDHVPRGARLASFVGVGCTSGWGTSRLEHLPGLAIARREAFGNDQWTVDGTHLLRVNPPWSAWVDPSHFVTAGRCPTGEWLPIEDALARLPLADFDHVWLIRPHPYPPALTAGWTVLWRHGDSVLFRLPPSR